MAGRSSADSHLAARKAARLGKISYRAQDNQSTMGGFVGTTTVNQGRGVMKTFRYVDGKTTQPSDAEVKKLRPEQ